jgi:hypothetical protein
MAVMVTATVQNFILAALDESPSADVAIWFHCHLHSLAIAAPPRLPSPPPAWPPTAAHRQAHVSHHTVIFCLVDEAFERRKSTAKRRQQQQHYHNQQWVNR